MRIIGRKQEIDWFMRAIANTCKCCPYYEECNRQAKIERNSPELGGGHLSCMEFLNRKIEWVIEE